mmetsp:Transcript_41483/g.96861  ORF Transcript_41483/g.96861 Transcript_41483/m.96861 type:complete len:196 (-) Transcript_41483:305-892(-)
MHEGSALSSSPLEEPSLEASHAIQTLRPDNDTLHSHPALPPGNKDYPEQYGQVKMMGTLWASAFARKYPNMKVFSVSPGMTRGTNFMSDTNDPKLKMFPCLAKFVGIFGVGHSLEKGADRYTQIVNHPDVFTSGHFYASAGGGVSGPLGDKTAKDPDLSNSSLQDKVFETISTALSHAQGVQGGGRTLPAQAAMG